MLKTSGNEVPSMLQTSEIEASAGKDNKIKGNKGGEGGGSVTVRKSGGIGN